MTHTRVPSSFPILVSLTLLGDATFLALLVGQREEGD